MRSLVSGFAFEKLRACLNCIPQVASASAKRVIFLKRDLR
jgi:hypothetical protein